MDKLTFNPISVDIGEGVEDSEWKEHFFEAMMWVENLRTEKKVSIEIRAHIVQRKEGNT